MRPIAHPRGLHVRCDAEWHQWRITLTLIRPTTPARAGQFVELNQSDLGGPVPCVKIFSFSFDPNHLHISRHPGPHKGAFRDRHERRVGMRWTRMARLTSVPTCGRRSRVVLTPRRWRQVGGRDSAGDGGKQARSPRRARSKLLKPSRAGMPGDPGATVVTNARATILHARLRVQRAPGIPRSLLRVAPAPLLG